LQLDTKTKTRFLAKPREIERFWGQLVITSRPTGGSASCLSPPWSRLSKINTAADTSLLFDLEPPAIFFRKFWANPLANLVGRGLIIARRHAETDLGGPLRRTGGKPFKGKLKTRFPTKPREIGRFGGQMEIILATTCSTRRTLGRSSANFEAQRQLLQGNNNLTWPTKKNNIHVTSANTTLCPESGCQRVIHEEQVCLGIQDIESNKTRAPTSKRETTIRALRSKRSASPKRRAL